MAIQTLNISPQRERPGAPESSRDSKNFDDVVHPELGDPKEAEVASELRRRFTEWEEADSEFQHNTDIELDFLSGRHWIEEETGQDKAKQMMAQGRSAFVIDLLSPSVDLVVNTIRVNKLTVEFVPMSEGAKQATADVRSGLYRNIDRQSKAPIARETGYQFAVSVGRGYWRVVIEDEDGPTFSRRLRIQRVDNLHSIAMDPTVLNFDYSDAGWGYAFEDLWRDEFKANYGFDGERALDLNGLAITDDSQRTLWFPKDKIRVGEYWRRKWAMREVWKLADGTEWWKEDVPPGAEPIRVKKKLDDWLEWRKMTGTQCVEKRLWPGKLIPIVVCIGREVFRGKRPKIHSGMVKPAMHPSRIHDYMVSRTIDEVGLAPLPHMMGVVGQLSPQQKAIVQNINRYPWSLIESTALEDQSGRALPPPQWVSPSPNTAAVVQATAGAKDDLQRVLNTFAPQLGEQQGKQSGVAISQIKQSGDVSHAAFPDNFNRALNQEAEIVNELMDFCYTDKQAITITQPDDKTKRVLINQEYVDQQTGKVTSHIFGQHKYGPVPNLAPSYASQMNESAQRLLDLAKSFPQVGQALDLIIQDLGVPNAARYAERLRPPGFKAGDDDGPTTGQLTQALQAQEQNLQQADKLIQMLIQKVKELGDVQFTKRLEIASKERIAAASDRAEILAADAKAGHAGNIAVLNAKLESILMALENELPENSSEPSPSTPTPAAPAPPGGPTGAPTGLNASMPPAPGGPAPGPPGPPQPNGAGSAGPTQ